ncbi:hypothetical protein Tco_1574859, partial [Tanacetum coccineum]
VMDAPTIPFFSLCSKVNTMGAIDMVTCSQERRAHMEMER